MIVMMIKWVWTFILIFRERNGGVHNSHSVQRMVCVWLWIDKNMQLQNSQQMNVRAMALMWVWACVANAVCCWWWPSPDVTQTPFASHTPRRDMKHWPRHLVGGSVVPFEKTECYAVWNFKVFSGSVCWQFQHISSSIQIPVLSSMIRMPNKF